MTRNVDTLYDEAFSRADRTEKYLLERQRFLRLHRDVELELLEDGYLADKEPEIRISAARDKANQLLQERESELFEFLDREGAALSAMNARDNAIVAAGWAQQFQTNKDLREFEGRLRGGLSDERRELE